MTRALVKLVNVTPRTDNSAIDPRYPNGVPPPATPNISVAAPPTILSTAGTIVSQNLSSYVTGTDATGYSMALVAVTGTLAGVGLSLSTTTISGTAAQGSFVYRLRATKSGYAFDAPTNSQIIVSASPSSDNVAPSVPAFFTAILDNATPKVTLAGDYPMDQRSGAIPPTDNQSVEIYKATDGGSYSLLTTKTASGPQPNPVMAFGQLGGATAGGSSQSGADFTITGVVDGACTDSVDSCNLWYGLVTLPVGGRITVTLPAYTVSGYDYSEVEVSIRQSLTTMDKIVRLIRRPNGNVVAPMLSRPTLGGAQTGYTGDLSITTGDAELCIEVQSSNQFQASYCASGVINTIPPQVCNFSNPVYICLASRRGTSGGAFSYTFKNLAINVQGRWSHNDTAVATGHFYDYKVRGKDAVP